MPELAGVVVGDEADAWRAAGFAVDANGVARIGSVTVRLAGRSRGSGLRCWTFAGVQGTGDLDGIPTDVAPVVAFPAADHPDHPNGAVAVDHVVVLTPDCDRTVAAFEGRGFEVRRVRHTDQYGPPYRQIFFRAGEVILEIIGPNEPILDDERPAKLFGVAVAVSDLDAVAVELGEALGRVKDALQPGRRIATLRREAFDVSVPVAFMS